MTGFPTNPFEPGFGVDPAYRGPRPDVESALSGLLGRTLNGARGSRAAFLYGPRGNGKTVLLNWFEREAAKARAPGGKAIAQVRISRTEMASPLSVANSVLSATSGFLDRFSLEANISVPGLGSIRIADVKQSQSLTLAQALSQSSVPLLITLDEAHEAPPERLGELLDVVQIAGRDRPIAVVLAGTPGLEATLRAAHTSFWSRGRKLRVGLLEEASAREALARPFRDAGLEADDGAVADLAVTADNYPYFLQLYGEAAWRAVEASGGRTFRPEHVASALAAADQARQDYYSDRYNEFDDAGMLPLARRVAEAFVGSAETPADRRLSRATLDGLVASGDGRDGKAFLIAKGYVWQAGSADHSWTPGIPSLMDYMLESIPAA